MSDPTLKLKFRCATYEGAQQIGIILIQAIQNELTGDRSGRWYPLPSNIFYTREGYKSLSKELKKKVNYHLKFVGAHAREEIYGSAYRASAPGEPPASRTGRLRQSFYMLISVYGENDYEVSIRTTVYYADDMEHGREKVSPRPFIEPAVRKSLPKIVAVQQNFPYRIIRGQ